MINEDILVIYPESQTTQVALFKGTTLLFLKKINHDFSSLIDANDIHEQLAFRTKIVIKELEDNHTGMKDIALVVGRGGLLKPVNAGVYEVNEAMVRDLKVGAEGMHHTNLGGLIAYEVAKKINAKPILADPVSVDEMDPLARISGHPLFDRKSIFHSLNQKFFARKYAKAHHVNYDELRLIMVTVGMGGISVAAHKKGNVVDVNNAFDGDGPFSIKRSGSVPIGDLVRLAYSGKYTEDELMRILTKEGGYAAYLKTSDLYEINALVENGDEKAVFISDACAYQVSKEIGAMYTALEGEVDAIIFTGNIFHSERFLENLKNRVGKIANITLYPSVNDVEALAENAFLVLKGELEIQEYN